MCGNDRVKVQRAVADISAMRDSAKALLKEREFLAYDHTLDILKRYLPEAFESSSHRIRNDW
jgi:hypothetical protein